MKKLNIVYTIDINYIKHFSASLSSLLETNKDIIGNIFLVTDLEKTSILNKIQKFYLKKYHANIIVLKIDSNVLSDLPVTHHLAISSYFRILLDQILPTEVDQVLLLDSDTIVLNSLNDFLNINFDIELYKDFYLFAVNHNLKSQDLKRLEKLGYDYESEQYFNAGVIFINLKRWRNEKIHELLLLNTKKYSKELLWMDQDVLNITFEKKWGKLDYKYNYFDSNIDFDSTPTIVHFAGATKPWTYKNNHKYKKIYIDNRNLSPFRYSILETISFNLIMIKIKLVIKNFLKPF